MDVLKILEKLVSFNTILDLQNQEIVIWIEKFLEKYKFKLTRLIDENTKKINLVAELGENPILAFAGHLDTVPVNGDWEKNPFELIVKNDFAYGLGVCDMKGGIAAFLKAVTMIDYQQLKKGLKLYFTFDEELYFGGIKLLVEKDRNIPPNLILAEPTDLVPITATKGCMDFEVQFFGKSVHSSMLPNGINAIVRANKFINEIMNLSEKLKQEENNMFEIPYATMNVGKIFGGDVTNRVPDKCTVLFDARTINAKQNIWIEEKVKSILQKYHAELKLQVNIAPMINENIEMIKTIEEITKNKSKAESYVTEASFIKNADSIILGVGEITAHECNEHIEIKKLKRIGGDICGNNKNLLLLMNRFVNCIQN